MQTKIALLIVYCVVGSLLTINSLLDAALIEVEDATDNGGINYDDVKEFRFKEAFDNKTYNDEFVRNRVFMLAASAYASEPKNCLLEAVPDFEAYNHVIVLCHDGIIVKGHCAAFIFVSHNDKIIYVSFRGTKSTIQLLKEIKDTALDKKTKSPIGGMVNTYFYDIFNLLWFQHKIGEAVLELNKNNPNYHILLTGHSLGGAVASIAAAQLTKHVDPSILSVITFGQPRTGDVEYATAFDALVKQNFILINQ